jgi:hypothetical protein
VQQGSTSWAHHGLTPRRLPEGCIGDYCCTSQTGLCTQAQVCYLHQLCLPVAELFGACGPQRM